MPNNGRTANPIFLDRTAKASFRWRDENKFIFLWGGTLVMVHADHESGMFFVLTDHRASALTSIYKWLYNSRQFILDEGEDYAEDRD